MINKHYKKAYLASGCFWGTEYWLNKTKGVISTVVGYSGGLTNNPSYDEICTGNTGHAETAEVTYDPKLTNYEKILKKFFETHNPGQMNRQGPDIGTQYRSAIFYQTDEEKETALNIIVDKDTHISLNIYNMQGELIKTIAGQMILLLGTIWSIHFISSALKSKKKLQDHLKFCSICQ